MNWETKKEMCSHFNNDREVDALKLVIDNIESMDEQAWDMFFTGVNLSKEDLEKNKDQHAIIIEKAKDLQSSSMITAIRMAAYEISVNDILQTNHQK